YRGGLRRVPEWERRAIDLDPAPRLRWPQGSPVIAVIGGARGIGAEIALEFARRDRASLALIGRTPEAGRPEDALRSLGSMKEASPGRVGYHSCDATDARAVEKLFEQLLQEHGRIDGIVHAAGLIEDRAIEQKDAESFTRVYAAKVEVQKALEAVAR